MTLVASRRRARHRCRPSSTAGLPATHCRVPAPRASGLPRLSGNARERCQRGLLGPAAGNPRIHDAAAVGAKVSRSSPVRGDAARDGARTMTATHQIPQSCIEETVTPARAPAARGKPASRPLPLRPWSPPSAGPLRPPRGPPRRRRASRSPTPHSSSPVPCAPTWSTSWRR